MSKKKKRPEPESLNLPLCGVDSHAHLDLSDPDAGGFETDLDEVLDAARRAGVARIGNVFLGPDKYERNRSRFDAHPEVFFILGMHPCDALDCTDEILSRMAAAFRTDTRLRALGEIGLDFYWDDAPHDVQEQVLRAQLRLARELDVPVVIHCRDAEADMLRVLDDENFTGRALLWHCFGGGPDLAEAVLSRGWQLSIPGPVTYRKAEELQAAVAMIPLERLLVETDCPYLTPEPWRGKRNHPALAAFTAAKIAELKGLDPTMVWRVAGENALRFFGLLPS
ncbi:MAG: TatD family hydrolase [Desulfovibrionaceae bacterium]